MISKKKVLKYLPIIATLVIASIAVLRFLGIGLSEDPNFNNNINVKEKIIQQNSPEKTLIEAFDSSIVVIENVQNTINNNGEIGTIIQNNKGAVNINNNLKNK